MVPVACRQQGLGGVLVAGVHVLVMKVLSNHLPTVQKNVIVQAMMGPFGVMVVGSLERSHEALQGKQYFQRHRVHVAAEKLGVQMGETGHIPPIVSPQRPAEGQEVGVQELQGEIQQVPVVIILAHGATHSDPLVQKASGELASRAEGDKGGPNLVVLACMQHYVCIVDIVQHFHDVVVEAHGHDVPVHPQKPLGFVPVAVPERNPTGIENVLTWVPLAVERIYKKEPLVSTCIAPHTRGGQIKILARVPRVFALHNGKASPPGSDIRRRCV